MAEYADPVIDWIDQDNVISRRFFRQVNERYFNFKTFVYVYCFIVMCDEKW